LGRPERITTVDKQKLYLFQETIHSYDPAIRLKPNEPVAVAEAFARGRQRGSKSRIP
jgi:hypothetical protein